MPYSPLQRKRAVGVNAGFDNSHVSITVYELTVRPILISDFLHCSKNEDGWNEIKKK